MDFDLGEPAAALRARLRALIAAHIAEDYLGAFTDDPADLDVAQRFCKTLADEGLLTLAWPTEYGGGGGSVWDQTVVREEMWAHHEPRGAQYMGLNWVGPAIMAFGTDAQKEQHLSAIAAGDVIWCQGFSEPEAGSDLASLRTRAVEDGDGWRITGQKIWTSYAGMAQWCVLAARVGPGRAPRGHHDVPRPDGHARASPCGPIRSMLGPHHLNEVFFDDVWAGPDAVLGGVGEGWAVIRKALAHERVGIARYARCERLLSALGQELAPHWDELPAVAAHASGRGPSCRCASPGCSPTAPCTPRRPASSPTCSPSSARIAVTQCDQAVAEVLFQAVEHEAVEAGPERPAPRRHRGPLALRPGGHRRLRHHRGAAHDRVQGAARRSGT